MSKTRGPENYEEIGFGVGKVASLVAAAREFLQNSIDAGATTIKVKVLSTEGGVMLVVQDDAPEDSEMSLRVFVDHFFEDGGSLKRTGSIGGKGDAKVMLSAFDGLVFGSAKDNFRAVSGLIRYAAISDGDLVTTKLASEEQKLQLTRLLKALPSVTKGTTAMLRCRDVGVKQVRRDPVIIHSVNRK